MEGSGHQRVRDQMVRTGVDTTPEDLEAIYRKVAADYDGQIGIDTSPRTVGEAFVKQHKRDVSSVERSSSSQPKTNTKPIVLDVCCGTGLVGVFLRLNGFDGDVDGLDLSKEMLEVSRDKRIYRNLLHEVVGTYGSLSIASDSYDGALCSAAFSQGHLKGDSLREIARIVRPGGLVVVNLRDDIVDMEEYGRPLKVAEQMCSEGTWEIVTKEQNAEYSQFNKCVMLTCRKC